MIQRMVKAVT